MESRSFPMQAVAQGGRVYDIHDDVHRDSSDCGVGDGIHVGDRPIDLEQRGDSDRADDLKE